MTVANKLGQAIHNAVLSRMDDGLKFTAFDITKDLRAKGHKIKHDKVRPLVHQLWHDGEMYDDYERTPIQTVGGEAWLYYSNEMDETDQAEVKNEFYKTDARGSLSIPAELIRQMGLEPGDEVDVFYDAASRCLAVVPYMCEDLDESPLANYTVNKSYQVRITESVLNKAGYLSYRHFTIEPDGSQRIIIKVC